MSFITYLGCMDIARILLTYINVYSYYYPPSGLTAGLIQTSGSANNYLNPISYILSAMYAQNAALADFRPYKALTTRNCLPCLFPNSGPAINYIFSSYGDVRNTFYMSAPITSNLFIPAFVIIILTHLRDTTVLYIRDTGHSVLCPSSQYLFFLLKFSPSCMSKTICHMIS